eukprot:1144729-Pelagomonas_calceolata.AAC.5
METLATDTLAAHTFPFVAAGALKVFATPVGAHVCMKCTCAQNVLAAHSCPFVAAGAPGCWCSWLVLTGPALQAPRLTTHSTHLKLDASGIVKLPFPQYSSSKSWLPLELDELVLAAPLLLLARAAGDGAAAAPAVLPVGAGPRESTCPACTSAAGGGGAAVVSVGAGSCAAVCPVCAAAGSVPLAAPDPSTPAALCSAAA